MVRFTLHTVAQALSSHSRAAVGIGGRAGSVVVRLSIGRNDPIVLADRFEVFNTATRDRWGVLEVIEVEGTSCICQVFDRINVEFWEELGRRMSRDPSPPSGVTFSREVPGGLVQFVERLIRDWGQ